MMHAKSGWAAIAATAILLAACGGSDDPAAPPPAAPSTPPVAPAPPAEVVTKVDVLTTSASGIDSIAYKDGVAYLGLANAKNGASAVLKSTLPLKAGATWSAVPLGACSAGAAADTPLRAPTLRTLGSTLWLFQPWYDGGDAAANEHALCALDSGAGTFVARDQGLKACYGEFCSLLSMTDLKQSGNVLYSNAGGAPNLLASNDGGAKWSAVLGKLDSMMCYHQSFEVIGDRVLVGGECPLDMAYVRAYRLRSDGLALASEQALPVTVPDLENRNVQFIQRIGTSQRVFIGVEGGLLRSEDGGQSFKFVIEHPLSGGANYPYIGMLLAMPDKPDTIVAGGFDKATGKPYLAWSADGGSKWTDISALLPGYANGAARSSASMVTSLGLDPQGRIVVTMNEDDHAKGSVLLLTLGKP